MIDMWQNYFGIALRNGAKNVPELKVALLASFFHIASSKTSHFHTYCPKTAVGVDIIGILLIKTNLYKPGRGLADEVINYVKPEYAKLTNEDELSRCLHGKTQNDNESFNALPNVNIVDWQSLSFVCMMLLVISIMVHKA